MGVIKQLNENFSIEKNRINLKNWRVVDIVPNGLNVAVYNEFYFVRNMDIIQFFNIANNDIKVTLSYSFIKTFLYCEKCNGTGSIDWIDKVTRNKEKNYMKFISKRKISFSRDINLPEMKMIQYGDPNNVFYISRTKLKKGSEYCYSCGGCGVRINNLTPA